MSVWWRRWIGFGLRRRRTRGTRSKPSSRDSAAERKRQAEERKKRSETKAGGVGKRKGKQRGAKDFGPKLTADPDVVIDHRPVECSGCGAVLDYPGVVGPAAGSSIYLNQSRWSLSIAVMRVRVRAGRSRSARSLTGCAPR